MSTLPFEQTMRQFFCTCEKPRLVHFHGAWISKSEHLSILNFFRIVGHCMLDPGAPHCSKMMAREVIRAGAPIPFIGVTDAVVELAPLYVKRPANSTPNTATSRYFRGLKARS